MVVKASIPEPKTQAKRLKKMTVKKSNTKKKLMKKAAKSKKVIEPTVKGETPTEVLRHLKRKEGLPEEAS